MALDEMAATPQTVTPEKSRVRSAASTMKSSLAAVPERGKQAGRAVRSHPKSVSAAALAVAGSAVAALVTRRQLKARAAKRTWWQRLTRR